MKSTYQALALLLALAAPQTILAVPAAAPSDTSSTPSSADDSINESKIYSDKLRDSNSSDESRVAADGKCIDVTFQSDNPNWNYFFNGDWGSGSGNVGNLGTKTLCGSGAMFVGEQTRAQGLGSAAGGNTKLECTVTGDGKGDNVCDISVVDGYSLSMLCTGFGSGEIGGTQNLFDLGTCPNKNPNGPTCVNTGGHTNTAAPFFKHGGKYWYQDNDFEGVTFRGTPKVHCAIHK